MSGVERGLTTQPLPIELLLGSPPGVLAGTVPELVSWGIGFMFKHATGVSIPAFGVVVLALTDPAVIQSGYRIVVALIIVLLFALHAHRRRTRWHPPEPNSMPPE